MTAELGIADLLAGGARSVTDLAACTGADAGSLRRLLRALARLGVFVELDVEHFANCARVAGSANGSAKATA